MWLNILAMALIVTLITMGLRYGMDLYTHHGQTVEVPSILHKSYNDAESMLDQLNLDIVVSDTDYVKTMPPDCVLEQSPAAGEIVKPGRLIYVKINDVKCEYIPGEKEWVYGIKCQGKQLATGDRVSIEDQLVIQVGDGRRDMSQAVTYIDSNTYYFGEAEEEDAEKPQASRPHYRRKTEASVEKQVEVTEKEQPAPTTSTFDKVDIPTVSTTPAPPPAPKPVKTE